MASEFVNGQRTDDYYDGKPITLQDDVINLEDFKPSREQSKEETDAWDELFRLKEEEEALKQRLQILRIKEDAKRALERVQKLRKQRNKIEAYLYS